MAHKGLRKTRENREKGELPSWNVSVGGSEIEENKKKRERDGTAEKSSQCRKTSERRTFSGPAGISTENCEESDQGQAAKSGLFHFAVFAIGARSRPREGAKDRSATQGIENQGASVERQRHPDENARTAAHISSRKSPVRGRQSLDLLLQISVEDEHPILPRSQLPVADAHDGD
jgi:hypothetical protein